MNNAITDVPGLKVGHWTDLDAATGCTVVLCSQGAMAGVDVRGGAPGTRETDLLAPTCTIDAVHAVLIAGGSAFGLAAADGVMRWLEERGCGLKVGIACVPIVPAAILFDLMIGRSDVRPDAAAGYAACQAASDGPIAQGNAGAGAGATVGKALGPEFITKGGLGTASTRLPNGEIVGALAAVNAFGNVHDLRGNIVAGVRNPNGDGFLDAVAAMQTPGWRDTRYSAAENTTLGIVATNARLTKADANKVAQMAHDGLARVIRPLHTRLDGDTVFALSLGDGIASVTTVGATAADTLAQAVINAVLAAESLFGVPAARDIER
jgi:L-aminopeptidase/D-esterase-like protein